MTYVEAAPLRHRDYEHVFPADTMQRHLWGADIAHPHSTPGRPLLRQLTGRLVDSRPTYAIDETTGRLDRTRMLGRRLTVEIEHVEDDPASGFVETVHLYTTKAAFKAANHGQGAEKIDWLYAEAEASEHIDPARISCYPILDVEQEETDEPTGLASRLHDLLDAVEEIVEAVEEEAADGVVPNTSYDATDAVLDATWCAKELVSAFRTSIDFFQAVSDTKK